MVINEVLSNNGITNITAILSAIAALGIAAAGLVDALKALPYGGVSNIGYGNIKTNLRPVAAAFAAIGELNPMDTLHANWINGVPMDQQKAIAKSLIHLGLTPANAGGMATAMGIAPGALINVATNIQNGMPLTPQDTNVFGRFDTMVSAILDSGYEKADQKYRNSAKFLAALFAVVLAVGASWLLGISPLFGIPIGLVSIPLAPVVKDLTSSIQAAANAVNTVKKA